MHIDFSLLGPILFILFPCLFLLVGGSFLMAIAWLAGSVNKHTVEVTVTHEEDRVADGHTVNLFTCTDDAGRTIDLQNSFSLYGWKFVRKTKAINALLQEDGRYRLTVAGLGWVYGQNIIKAEAIKGED